MITIYLNKKKSFQSTYPFIQILLCLTTPVSSFLSMGLHLKISPNPEP